jgi:uncharacterized protein (TIGR01244 family)
MLMVFPPAGSTGPQHNRLRARIALESPEGESEMRRSALSITILTLLLLSSVGLADPATGAKPIPSAREPIAGLLSTGQPTPEEIAALAAAGYRTVINLRGTEEPGFEWEKAAVEGAGMRYVQIPITGAADLTRETVVRFDEALGTALHEGKVLLHCATGNRNGALLALREAWLRGVTPEAALELGTAAGLTRLEPSVRTLLGLPPAASP